MDFKALEILFSNKKLPKVLQDIKAGEKLDSGNLRQLHMIFNNTGRGFSKNMSELLVKDWDRFVNKPLKLTKNQTKRVLYNVKYDVFMGNNLRVLQIPEFTREEKHIVLDAVEVKLIGPAVLAIDQKYMSVSDVGMEFEIIDHNQNSFRIIKMGLNGVKIHGPSRAKGIL